jgi:hypothetical protein
MTAPELLKSIRDAGGSVRLHPEGVQCSGVPKSLVPELKQLKSEVTTILSDENRIRTCPECGANFDTVDGCTHHMLYDCPCWCTTCNNFIVRIGHCPGCDPKGNCDENYRRLVAGFNLKPVSRKRLKEIEDGQKWQILPKQPYGGWRY